MCTLISVDELRYTVNRGYITVAVRFGTAQSQALLGEEPQTAARSVPSATEIPHRKDFQSTPSIAHACLWCDNLPTGSSWEETSSSFRTVCSWPKPSDGRSSSIPSRIPCKSTPVEPQTALTLIATRCMAEAASMMVDGTLWPHVPVLRPRET